jgi:tetratricopeptide (TPR) repeat protein
MRWDPTVESSLSAAAFGNQPGRWPLPTASTPRQLWLRAVAAGGQGRYGSARTDLESLLRSRPADRLASLAHSTQGSFLRQLGWHSLARGCDGRALALARADPEASADALIGLAADALGIGRLAASAKLLSRADRISAEESAQRLSVRRAWVAAELAMAAGDGATAVRHAEVAVELASTTLDGSAWRRCGPERSAVEPGHQQVSVRHCAKSDMVLAAALCSAGAVDRARDVADEALEVTGRLGLVPLRWALACLLVDVGSATHTTRELCGIRDMCAEQVRHRGGSWYRS